MHCRAFPPLRQHKAVCRQQGRGRKGKNGWQQVRSLGRQKRTKMEDVKSDIPPFHPVRSDADDTDRRFFFFHIPPFSPSQIRCTESNAAAVSVPNSAVGAAPPLAFRRAAWRRVRAHAGAVQEVCLGFAPTIRMKKHANTLCVRRKQGVFSQQAAATMGGNT